MFPLIGFSSPDYAYAQCSPATVSYMKGIWISNDKTKNRVSQDTTHTPGAIHIDWNGRTHDELRKLILIILAVL